MRLFAKGVADEELELPEAPVVDLEWAPQAVELRVVQMEDVLLPMAVDLEVDPVELLEADLEELRGVVRLLPAMPMETSSIYTNRCREVERSKR